MASLLALCLLHFLSQQDAVPATYIGVTLAFLLGFPWLRQRLLARVSSSVFNFAAGRKGTAAADPTVIEGEFREMKD